MFIRCKFRFDGNIILNNGKPVDNSAFLVYNIREVSGSPDMGA